MTVLAAPAPLVSVVITAYRRPDSLWRALRSAQAQIHEPKEILVIESLPRGEAASPPIVPDATGVRIVQVEDRGVCAARNLGARLARGAFVAVMDDDTYFPTVHELDRLVAAFDRSPHAACLVFRVLDTAGHAHLRDWCHPRSFWDAAEARFETCFIAEGACAFRREAFVRVGGYYEPFWIGNEGWDLALRLLDADLTIVYEPTVSLCHAVDARGRTPGRIVYLRVRNYIWTAFKDYPGWRRWPYLAYSIALMAMWSVHARQWRPFACGLRDGMTGQRSLPRTPISPRGWARLREIRRFRPGLLARLRKLRELRQHPTPL